MITGSDVGGGKRICRKHWSIYMSGCPDCDTDMAKEKARRSGDVDCRRESLAGIAALCERTQQRWWRIGEIPQNQADEFLQAVLAMARNGMERQ